MIERLLSIVKDIFPDKCIICSKSGKVICVDCMEKVNAARIKNNGKKAYLGIDANITVYQYSDTFPEVKRAVLMMKDKYLRGLFSLMAQQMSDLASSTPSFASAECVTYVPRSRQNLHDAGFDQSAFLSKYIARGLNLPYKTMLKRRGRSSEQKMLSQTERAENVKGKFSAINTTHYKNIILVDDVLTTGATACEAAKELKSGGVEKVYLLTLAKR